MGSNNILMEAVRKLNGGKEMTKSKGKKQYRYGRITEKTIDDLTYTLNDNPECEVINIQHRWSLIQGWEYVGFYKRLLKKGEELGER